MHLQLKPVQLHLIARKGLAAPANETAEVGIVILVLILDIVFHHPAQGNYLFDKLFTIVFTKSLTFFMIDIVNAPCLKIVPKKPNVLMIDIVEKMGTAIGVGM